MRAEIQKLVEEAGREIRRIYESGQWTVSAKGDESPITQADLAANSILVPGIAKLSHDPIVSEESDPFSVKVENRFWLIDPLDGTRDFVHRLDTFVVCVALVENSYPVFGMIHSPITGETWWAEKGKGAYGPQGRKIVNESTRSPLIAVGSRTMPSDRMQLLYDTFDVGEVRRFGSALKFCRLAEGDADVYPRFGPMYEWDTAAGQIIVEEAGCKVIEIASGERLRYGKPGFENNGGFVASRSDIDFVTKIKASGLYRGPSKPLR